MAEQRNEQAEEVADDGSGYATLASGLARLDAVARAEAAVGTPRSVGERTVIPLAEVYYGAGFGLGQGRAPASSEGGSGMGGGGGFGGRVRPVAVVDVGPEGVRVRPVFDASAIGLALVTVGLATLARLWRRPNPRH
ncbi:MAG TPA: spore germination protein GerW family protein [Chloroflexota bacterium]|nr:spore germination protein GerW family protein [Chloroflexota bacterium]